MLTLEEIFPPFALRIGCGPVADEQRVVVTPATFVRPDEEVVVDGADRLRAFPSIALTTQTAG